MCESTLYSAATLNLHGLPYDFGSLQPLDPPFCCPTCNAAMTDPLHPKPLHTRQFTWQSHLGRCGGDGRCLQAHEILKLSLKRMTLLANVGPGGVAIASNQLLIEPGHLRSDDSRPGDLYGVVGGLHADDADMDLMVTSSLSKSTLLHTSKSFDCALRLTENKKFTTSDLHPYRYLPHKVYPSCTKPVRQTRPTLRGHAPRICLPPHQALLMLQPPPRAIRGSSDGGTSKGPFLLGFKTNVDYCCSKRFGCPSKSSEELKHTKQPDPFY